MADKAPTTVTDEPAIIPAQLPVSKTDDEKGRSRYGKVHGIEGKVLQERWAAIPDGLREAYRIQARKS